MKTISLMVGVAAVAFARAFMSDVCEVVTIDGPDGPMRVNKSDFDADQASDKPTMKLHKDNDQTEQSVAGTVRTSLPPGVTVPPSPSAPNFTAAPADPNAPKPPVPGAPVPPTIPAPGALLVKKEGTGKNIKVFVVDTDGNKITDRDGIDEAGYPDEQAAWDAILAATPH